MSDDDDDCPRLSAATLAALQEFQTEQQQLREELESQVKTNGSQDSQKQPRITEDWQLSQFWYSKETSQTLAEEAIKVAEGGKIALVSCPTLYGEIKNFSREQPVTLFEFDQRFAMYGSDFCFYDYRSPLDLPIELARQFEVVVVDPPFLSEECLTKTAITVRFLAKDKLILCTGAVMEDLAKRLLQVHKTKFQPQHSNNLANEFCCYVNFSSQL